MRFEFNSVRSLQDAKLRGHERKFSDVCCAQFGLGRGARCFRTGTRSIPRQWGCDRRATKPQAKFGATLRAAVLFGPGCLARSLQIRVGYALVPVRKHLAPCRGRKLLAANVTGFTLMTTKAASCHRSPRCGAPLDCGDMPPLFLHARQGEGGSELLTRPQDRIRSGEYYGIGGG